MARPSGLIVANFIGSSSQCDYFQYLEVAILTSWRGIMRAVSLIDLLCWIFRASHGEVFTTEAQSSQSPE
jgi:hypothetical protein